jgi:dTDP-glucose 4,6-dehydratase
MTWDLEVPFSSGLIQELGQVNIIIHMAAETHVDRSIADPIACIKNNVMSTVNLLEYARALPNFKLFELFSTDETYGKIDHGSFKEWDYKRPGNPYSASKSASEEICLAYHNTFKLPILISNLMNTIGLMQEQVKYIPMCCRKILAGETVIIHTKEDGFTPGSRFYIDVNNVADAILFILDKSHLLIGDKINIPGVLELSNQDVAERIAKILGRELKYELTETNVSRPGVDSRYALNGEKLFGLGWIQPSVEDFEKQFEEIILWTVNNKEWLNVN